MNLDGSNLVKLLCVLENELTMQKNTGLSLAQLRIVPLDAPLHFSYNLSSYDYCCDQTKHQPVFAAFINS